MSAQPRLVVSAPSSGHGKTAIAVGLLAACVARGVPAAGFKVGPDHTDAAYLGLAAGRPGRNLDPRLVGAQRIAPLFSHGASGAQLSVIEGAMGLFDSLTGQPEIDGTAAVAAALRAPVVLVVDVAAMGHSIAALVHGFRMFDEMVHLGGVILNRVASPRHEQMLRTALDDIGMPVLGALRRGDLPNVLPARAHGPVPVAHRTVEASRAVRRLGEAVLAGLDLDRLLGLANAAPALPGPIWTPGDAVGGEVFDHRPIVALAGGPGAPYTYVETAELLTAAGADVAVVDPLRDESLPAGTRALIVGAGLPEGYAEELSANRRLCNAVAKFAHDGWPVVAEGVALPWLGRDFDGRPMCAVLDASAVTGDQTVAGYREATAPTTSSLAPAGARITGYKQHRAIVTPRAGTVPAWTWSGGNPEGFVWRQVHASQLGLHWAAAPEIAKRVVAAAIVGPPGPQQNPAPHSPTPHPAGSHPQAAHSQAAHSQAAHSQAAQAPGSLAPAAHPQPERTQPAHPQPERTQPAHPQPAHPQPAHPSPGVSPAPMSHDDPPTVSMPAAALAASSAMPHDQISSPAAAQDYPGHDQHGQAGHDYPGQPSGPHDYSAQPPGGHDYPMQPPGGHDYPMQYAQPASPATPHGPYTQPHSAMPRAHPRPPAPGSGPIPGGPIPGSAMPGGAMSGSAMPGGVMSGSANPGGPVPGGLIPGGQGPGGPVSAGGPAPASGVASVPDLSDTADIPTS
jgi:cobyrinic acid a,c-diamide synthase